MVFVHARNETTRTAIKMRDMASQNGTLQLFSDPDHPEYSQAMRSVQKSPNKDLRMVRCYCRCQCVGNVVTIAAAVVHVTTVGVDVGGVAVGVESDVALTVVCTLWRDFNRGRTLGIGAGRVFIFHLLTCCVFQCIVSGLQRRICNTSRGNA